MPTIPKWLSTPLPRTLRGWREDSQPPTPSLQIVTRPTPNPDPSLRCPCHPNMEVVATKLCNACNEFISKCHWIQLYKLPSSQFSKLSERQLKRGSYVNDGDAGMTLHWDYIFSSRRLTKDCPLCELIGTVWEEPSDHSGHFESIEAPDMTFTVQFRSKEETDEARLDILIKEDVAQPHWFSLRLYHEWKEGYEERRAPKHQRTTIAEKRDPIVVPMGKCTASFANFKLAQSWLKSCILDHPRCHIAHSAESKYPSRLIAVGSEAKDPWLFEIEPGKDIPQYITLSHCWGGRTPLMLTQESLESQKKGIPLYKLSKTFQEAIKAVRRLEFGYIWIDSLCIIQDSKEDWEKESQFMGSIYRNAVCTIAATASKDGDGGLFRIRNPLRNQRCEIWCDNEHGIYAEIENGVPLERYRREVSGGPLNSRAWVLQERYLSPRVLHFASGAVYWDCREAHFCDYGKTLEDEASLSLGFGAGYARPFEIPESDLWGDLNDFRERWKFAIEKYSRMELTRESDRLVALRGLTKHLEERTSLESLFGVWKERLPEYLLWRLGNASLRRLKRSDNAIPSWSWASIEMPMRYFPPNIDDLALTFWHPSPFGGWPDRGVGRMDDSNLVDEIVSDMTRQIKLGVDPENGYSSEKIICATYLEQESNGSTISISAKLNMASHGDVMIVEDMLTDEQVEKIMNALQIKDAVTNSEDHKLLICHWPDTSEALPTDHFYLRLQVEGAYRPTTDCFLNRTEHDLLIAQYALHTSGITVAATEVPNVYTRIGYFRATETFGKAPAPHPKCVNLEDKFFGVSWFGTHCQEMTIKII